MRSSFNPNPAQQFQQQQQQWQQQLQQQRTRMGGAWYAKRQREEQERLRAEQHLASLPQRFDFQRNIAATGLTRPQPRQQFHSVPPQAKSGCLGSLAVVVSGILLLSTLL